MVNPVSIPPDRYIWINFEGANAHYICSSPQDLTLKLLIYIWYEFNARNLHFQFGISDFEVNTWKWREGARSWKEQEKVQVEWEKVTALFYFAVQKDMHKGKRGRMDMHMPSCQPFFQKLLLDLDSPEVHNSLIYSSHESWTFRAVNSWSIAIYINICAFFLFVDKENHNYLVSISECSLGNMLGLVFAAE